MLDRIRFATARVSMGLGVLGAAAAAAMASCSSDDNPGVPPAAETGDASAQPVTVEATWLATPRAASRLRDLGASYHLALGKVDAMEAERNGLPAGLSRSRPVIVPVQGTRFDRLESGGYRPVLAEERTRGVLHKGIVTLPETADGFARVEDSTTHMQIRFRMLGAGDVQPEVADGLVLYRGPSTAAT